MQCKTCHEELIQKDRWRLFLVGNLMCLAILLPIWHPLFWAPSVISFLTGAYLITWATAGKGRWCRTCKRFPFG